MPCILLLNKARYTPLLKPKQKLKLKDRMKNDQPRRKRKNHVWRGTYGRVSRQHDHVPLTTVRGEYHGSTVVASGRCGSLAS